MDIQNIFSINSFKINQKNLQILYTLNHYICIYLAAFLVSFTDPKK